jgi:surface carbohydrate biosynthesis protein
MPGVKNLLFPIEVINRELDYRIVLACLAAKPGNRVFIGQHDALARAGRHMRGGIYLGKNIFYKGHFPNKDLTRYRQFKERGFTLIHLDEEGGNYFGDAQVRKNELSFRLDPRVLAPEDRVCTWGDFQRDHYLSLSPMCARNIQTTGHPKFDLLKAKHRAYFGDEAARLRARFGEFILVNTNLTAVNNPLGYEDSFSATFNYDPADPVKRRNFIGYWASVSRILGAMLSAVNACVDAYPGATIVIRPHPAEDFGFYKRVFAGVPGVHVLHEGTVSPWLLACKALVHNGCTTAIEAYFAGTPVISYALLEDKRYDFGLANMVGTVARTQEEVVAAVGAALAGKQNPDQSSFEAEAGQLFDNIRGDSYAKLLSVVEQVERELEPVECSYERARHEAAEARYRAVQLAKGMVRPFFPAKQKHFEFTHNAGNFSWFKKEDVRARFDRAQKSLGVSVRHRVLSPELIVVER